MPTIWGTVNGIDTGTSCVQVKTALSVSTIIHVRALVTPHTLVVRGIERIAFSGLREGDCVEIDYRHGRKGVIDAETSSVRSDAWSGFSKEPQRKIRA